MIVRHKNFNSCFILTPLLTDKALSYQGTIMMHHDMLCALQILL